MSRYLLLIRATLLFFTISIYCSRAESLPAESNKKNQVSIDKEKIRPEHVAFNSSHNAEIASWYKENLGLIIVRQSGAPSYNSFIADSTQHMMLELVNIPEAPYLDFAKLNHMTMHFAFMVNEIEKTKDALLKAGCKIAEDIKNYYSGDKVVTLRDPWNFPLQLVQRLSPKLHFSKFRFEHIAINVEDPPAVNKWFVENLGLKIINQGGPPTYASFIGDVENNIMFEIYHNEAPFLDLNKMHYSSLHFAFAVDNLEEIKKQLLANGATLEDDIKLQPNGDKILMLRTPFGLPIQFVLRKECMLK